MEVFHPLHAKRPDDKYSSWGSRQVPAAYESLGLVESHGSLSYFALKER